MGWRREYGHNLREVTGQISIRSAYRSAEVNAKGAEKSGYNCASNSSNAARHIWDLRDAKGHVGAMACIVVTRYLPFFARTGNWQALGWWIHDHIAGYSAIEFFTKAPLLAFNIGWHEHPRKTVHAWAPHRNCLTKPGMANHGGNHASEYKACLPSRET